jgi:hypothetical protein
MLPGAYQFVYTYVGEIRRAEIRKALHDEPRLFRRIAFASRVSPDVVDPTTGWHLLSDFCSAVEQKMASILCRHSLYYWLYLYRRLGVRLDPGHENKTDAVTVGLVRLTLEAAIQKYARLDISDDVVPPTSLPVDEWFGGVLKKAIVALAGDADAKEVMERLFSQPSDMVPADFTEDTLVDLYRLEGYAYEYWLTMALMRTLGKGGVLRITDAGPDVDRPGELDDLVRSYDARIETIDVPSSNIGVAFPPDPKDKFVAPVPVYNVEHLPPVFPPDNTPFRVSEGTSTNFLVVPLHIGAFLEAHRFAEAAFEAAKGFHLSSVCAVLAGIAWKDFVWRSPGGKLDTGRALQLWQRGYVFAPRDPEELVRWSEELMREWRPPDSAHVAADGHAVLEYLTLDTAKQAKIGLWSRGPLYPFIPLGDKYLVDLAAIPYRLRNEFFGVRHNQQAKGPLFEETFRDTVEDAGFELLRERELRFSDEEKREVDAAVRIGKTLLVCDCKAMERPLNFDQGSLRQIQVRCAEFDKKVDQVLSLAEFLRSYPVGRNYDFSWATQIVPLVLSPFVEWIWSRDARLWVTQELPRILTMSEALSFFRKLSGGVTGHIAS